MITRQQKRQSERLAAKRINKEKNAIIQRLRRRK